MRKLSPSILVFFMSLIIYTLTLYRGVPGGDSGEFITAAKVLGVAHPPGYPLYTLIAHVFTWLPDWIPQWKTVAGKINWMSALCDAFAASLLAESVIQATKSRTRWVAVTSGLLGGMLYAFSPSIWRDATQAEVFPLNNFFISLLLFLSVVYSTNPSAKLRNLICITAGLALFHQQTFIFYFLPILIWIFHGADRKSWIKLGALVLIGALPYFYLPIADSAHPPFGWGELTTGKGFFIHFFRREYGTFSLGTSAWKNGSSFLSHLWFYFSSLPKNSLGIFFVFAIPGIWFTLKSRQLWTLIAFFSYLIVFSALSNAQLDQPLHRGVEARFWQQPDTVVFFWIGLGFAWCFSALEQYRAQFAFVSATVIAITASFAQARMNYPENNHAHDQIVEDYARALLKDLEPNSLLIVTSDLGWNATQYLQLCENIRTDVRVVSQEMLTYIWMAGKMTYREPSIVLPGKFLLSQTEADQPVARYDERYLSGSYSMLSFLDANANRFPIYLAFEFKAHDRTEVLTRYQRIPMGILDRIIPIDSRKPRAQAIWIDPENALTHPNDSWEYYLGQLVTVQKYLFDRKTTQ